MSSRGLARHLEIDLDVHVGVELLRDVLDEIYGAAGLGLIGRLLVLLVLLDLVKVDNGEALLLDEVAVGLTHRYLREARIDRRILFVVDHVVEAGKIVLKVGALFRRKRGLGRGGLI